MRYRHVRIIAAAVLSLLASQASAQDREVEKHLRDEYQGKTLALRGFYSGDHLRYGSAGTNAAAGDWTADGFVQVADIHLSHQRLTIEARRLIVIELDGKQFQFLANDKERQKLEIEIDLNSNNISPEEAEAALANVFLTAHDDLSTLVPDYWKPCVRSAAAQQRQIFSFSPELLAVPGVAASQISATTPSQATDYRDIDCASRRANRRGLFPRAIYQPSPEFSEKARRAKFQGVVVLTLVVDEKGMPENIRIIKPAGMGLDEKALECVRKWRFQPAEKDGEPVAQEISVQVDFHLY